jgi:O-methyltransferase
MMLHSAMSGASYGLAHYRHPDRTRALGAVTKARNLAYTATTPLECVELYHAVKATAKVPGEMAEVGVYLGGTAAIMLSAAEDKHLHLFDTFQGLPTGGDFLKKGEYAGSMESVTRTLSAYKDRISLHEGLFPADSSGAVTDERFSFVHLDMDLYEGTLDALRFFWPRMNSGGIILSHDYPAIEGVRRAMDEFFLSEDDASFLPLSGQQALAVKI